MASDCGLHCSLSISVPALPSTMKQTTAYSPSGDHAMLRPSKSVNSNLRSFLSRQKHNEQSMPVLTKRHREGEHLAVSGEYDGLEQYPW